MQQRIRTRLAAARPGRRYATFGREPGKRGDFSLDGVGTLHEDLKAAAVLVPLVARRDGFTVILTQRTDHLDAHAGQISFPGGRVEEGDHDDTATALRETEEEIGLARRHVEIVGRLDTYETGTGFVITPIVGLVTPPFDLDIDSYEVAEVFEVPLAFILDSTNHHFESRVFAGQERRFYVLPYEKWRIWGATAHMLVNLYEELRDR